MTRLARALVPLLLAGGTLQAQYSSLGVTSASLRFFRSPKDYTPLAERIYPATFDSATTQYITTELSIDYPRTAAPVKFTINCRYVGPRGEDAGTPAISATVQGGWTGSYHVAGWGSVQGGGFGTGRYQVSCRDGATLVAAGSFLVTNDRWDIPEIRGMVSRIRIYEGPDSIIPIAQRQYPDAFDGSAARYIKTEVWLDFQKSTALGIYTMDCSYKYPNGEVGSFAIDHRIQAGWIDAVSSNGYGHATAGGWAKGTYGVTCSYKGTVVAERTFTVN